VVWKEKTCRPRQRGGGLGGGGGGFWGGSGEVFAGGFFGRGGGESGRLFLSLSAAFAGRMMAAAYDISLNKKRRGRSSIITSEKKEE